MSLALEGVSGYIGVSRFANNRAELSHFLRNKDRIMCTKIKKRSFSNHGTSVHSGVEKHRMVYSWTVAAYWALLAVNFTMHVHGITSQAPQRSAPRRRHPFPLSLV